MAMAVLLRVLENFQGDREFRSKRRTKTERRSNASFGPAYVELFCEIHLPQCHSATVPHLLNLLNREETVAKVVPAISKSRPETYAAHPAADEAEQLNFRGGKNTLTATSPHCRGKLGFKHL